MTEDILRYLPKGVSGGLALVDYYAMALNLLVGVGLGVGLVGIIMAGIQFVTSRGDAKSTDKAKHALTYSVVGVVLALGAYSVKLLILSSLGVDSGFLSNPVPKL